MLKEFSAVQGSADDTPDFSKNEWELARFKCGLLLPLLVEQMAEVWVPLKKKILEAEAQ
ncbi:MAG TPA: hypothetical protein VNZ03_13005 [Terriglobales bacterium]|jgi:hypothetical protein|nr:hypothetical protein [Terriglobales bacterium]